MRASQEPVGTIEAFRDLCQFVSHGGNLSEKLFEKSLLLTAGMQVSNDGSPEGADRGSGEGCEGPEKPWQNVSEIVGELDQISLPVHGCDPWVVG